MAKSWGCLEKSGESQHFGGKGKREGVTKKYNFEEQKMRKKQAILPKNILAQNIPEGAVVPWLVWLSCPVAGPIAGCGACRELQPSWPATATCSAQPAS